MIEKERDETAAVEGFRPLVSARTAGLLYLAIVVLGIFTEVAVRGNVFVQGDAAATAEAIVASQGLFRLGFLTDSLMLMSDATVAVLLYLLLRPVSRTVALLATAFRLIQTSVLALNLLHHYAALLLLDGAVFGAAFAAEQRQALAYHMLELHAHGYDLGLVFFGLHCVLLGWLIHRSGFLPRALGILVAAAGVAYLVGSYTRFLFPGHVGQVAPVYAVALVAEVALGVWLLVKGVRVEAWARRAGVSLTEVMP